MWDRRVAGWHAHVTSTSGFDTVLNRLLAISGAGAADACVDLGAGTGFVTLALAPLAGSVLAVDISPVMAESLAGHAAQVGFGNVTIAVADLRTCASRLPSPSSCSPSGGAARRGRRPEAGGREEPGPPGQRGVAIDLSRYNQPITDTRTQRRE
jgi:Methyltransferase domain